MECRCASCTRYSTLCHDRLHSRTIKTYRTAAAARAVASRMANNDTATYAAVRLPRHVLDLTSALLVSGSSQAEAFKTALLLASEPAP